MNRVCDEYGFVRPKVDMVYNVTRWAYLVRVVFAMKWVVNWETDATQVSEIFPELFDDMAEGWAMDANVPLTEATEY